MEKLSSVETEKVQLCCCTFSVALAPAAAQDVRGVAGGVPDEEEAAEDGYGDGNRSEWAVAPDDEAEAQLVGGGVLPEADVTRSECGEREDDVADDASEDDCDTDEGESVVLDAHV